MPMAYHTNTALQNCAFCHILLACIASQRQHQKSRSTGHGNAWTRPDSTGADEAPAPEADTDEETETAPAAEPPRNQSQKRNDRRARASTTAAETRPPADSQPQKSRRDRARAREPEARHCRPRETDGDRKTKREEKKRGNEEKTTVKRRFSPSLTERPADQPPEPADTDSSRNAAFFGSAFVEYAELTEINANFAICIGGVGLHFHDFSNAKNLALYPLLHASIFFTKHHLSNTPFINDIFPYKYKYLLLQTCLRKNALINAGSSSLDQHTKIHFYNFMLRNMP